MRLALPCTGYTPRHAAPREPLAPHTRQVLAVGLAAALLPLGAAPALADDAPTATTSAGAQQAASPAPAGPAPTARPAAPERSNLRFTAPAVTTGRAVPVGVRLLADGKGVRNGYVRLEKSTGAGWTYVGRLLTDSTGLGHGTLRVAGTSRLRAAYAGSGARTAAVSGARLVRPATQHRAAPATARLVAAPTAGDAVAGSAVLAIAARYVGTPYSYGGTTPGGFDCSGFTRYVYGQLGVSLPHNSDAQQAATTPVRQADARPGDLVFLPGHVGIYAGDGKMYDSPRAGRSVSLRAIYSSSYRVGRVG